MEASKIKKLDENVINRIAAGEVIQRPVNALKEMIENSLDAKATNIQITVKDGGLKLLQIQDNGTGIRKEDMEIVCERFTTSKLRDFEDLNSIATYGFRGEALASISHVAHLTIQSKTAGQACAYRACYVDGRIDGAPKPTGGNQGTQITVEDLFYNMSVRKKALRSAAEEYQKISEVVGKYAIHNAHVGFSLKKSGGNIDIKTPCKSNQVDNIRVIYGSVAKGLVEFEVENKEYKFKARGFLSGVDYTNKKFIFLLFINHRLVDNQSLKKCIDQIYTNYLPKNMHPFVYLSLELDPKNVDVNVHPTKHEVNFLNEGKIIELIIAGMENKLLGSNNSRILYTQSKLPGAALETIKSTENSANQTIYAKDLVRTDCNQSKLQRFFGNAMKISEQQNLNQTNYSVISNEVNVFENAMEKNEKPTEVATKVIILADEESVNQTVYSVDSNEVNVFGNALRKSEKPPQVSAKTTEEENSPKPTGDMVQNPLKKSEKPPNNESVEDILNTTEDNQNFENMVLTETPKKTESNETTQVKASLISRISKCETQLSSVLELRQEMEIKTHSTLRELFAQHVFVGCIDPGRSLLQYSTRLYLCNTKKIMEELFYQVLLYNFENFGKIRFKTPLSILEMAQIALDLPETDWKPEDGDKNELAKRVVEILIEKREMLDEYFSIEIDENAGIKSIPHLLDKYLPEMSALPLYLLRLASEVNWEQEKGCFKTICRETAMFYSQMKEDGVTEQDWKWTTEHVVYPAVKEFFLPPKKFLENAAVLQIADLPSLYKVFERC